VVDENGEPIPSPPWVQRWGEEGSFAVVGPDGTPVPIPKYQPPLPPPTEGGEEEEGSPADLSEPGMTAPTEAAEDDFEAPAPGSEPGEGVTPVVVAEEVARPRVGASVPGEVATVTGLTTEAVGLTLTGEPVTEPAVGEDIAPVVAEAIPPAATAEGPAEIGIVDFAAKEGVASMRGPLPGPAGEGISVIPITIPMPPPPQGDEGPSRGMVGSGEGRVSVTPINIPKPLPPDPGSEAAEVGLGGPAGEGISVIPITIPMPPPPEAEPPTAGPGTDGGGAEVADLPGPMPGPGNAGRVATLPIPLPEPGEIAAPDMSEVATLPLPIPEPGDAGGFVLDEPVEVVGAVGEADVSPVFTPLEGEGYAASTDDASLPDPHLHPPPDDLGDAQP
jgi:hypothetical protein